MLKLGESGFEFCDHGCGLDGEDFGLCIDGNYYVNFCDTFCDTGKKVIVYIYKDDDKVNDDDCLYIGTIAGALKFLKVK